MSHKAILANLGHGTERFHICYQHRDPTRAQHARISHSTGLPGWQWGITPAPGEQGYQGHKPFLEEKHAELYRLQELWIGCTL